MSDTKKRCVLIGAAEINNYDRVRSYLEGKDDFYVFCDGGLRHRERLGVEPDLIVGDFDSHDNPMLDIETIVLPREKDDTDTFFAVKEAVKRNFDDFLLLGVFGQRLDHTFGNISILMHLAKLKKTALAIDDFAEFEIVAGNDKDDEIKYIDSSFSYFSLISLCGRAEGISVKNAKYPLSCASIACDYQYGISNEVLPDLCASVSLKKGWLLLIKVF